MAGRYLTELAAWLRAAGLTVVEYDGWPTRARSSGGYASGRPVCVMWHHTASSTSPANDAAYMCHGSDSRPIANLLVARDGAVWVLAAGATNTNGKGQSLRFSRGTVPADSMNTWAVGMEIANNGVGEPYPPAQIDSAFASSLAVCAALGLAPDDVAGHVDYSPGRKIDPATAAAVQGPWRPRSINSSGSWNVADLRAELIARAAATILPPDPEPDEEDDDMPKALLLQCADGPHAGAIAVAPPDLSRMTFLSTGEDYSALAATGSYDAVSLSAATFDRIPGAEQWQQIS